MAGPVHRDFNGNPDMVFLPTDSSVLGFLNTQTERAPPRENLTAQDWAKTCSITNTTVFQN
jgi:hypothetical protein